MFESEKKGYYFTEKEYLTLEEIKEKFNLENVDSIYDEVIKYRSLFRKELSLTSPNGIPYYLTICSKLLSEENAGLKKFLPIFTKYYHTANFSKKEAYANILLNHLIFIAKHYGLEAKRDVIGKIITSLDNQDLNYKLIGNYAKVCIDLLNNKFDEINPSVVININSSLQSLDSLNDEDYKKEELEELFIFLNENEDLPLFTQAAIILYFFFDHKLFSYLNEETACITIKLWLKFHGFAGLSFYFPVEYLIYDIYPSVLSAFNNSKSTNDLTYYSLIFIKYMVSFIPNVINVIDKISTKNSSITDKPTIPTPIFDDMKNIHLEKNQNFDKQNNQKEEKNVKEFLENYPSLHYIQAHFYLSHNTIGKFYTVDQFRLYENVAYETARTSMDFLAKLGFYTKGKVGKKFTYTPLPQQETPLNNDSSDFDPSKEF